MIIYFNSHRLLRRETTEPAVTVGQLYTALRDQNFKSLIFTYKTRILGLAALLSQ